MNDLKYEIINVCPSCNNRKFFITDSGDSQCCECGDINNYFDLVLVIVDVEEEIENVHNR